MVCASGGSHAVLSNLESLSDRLAGARVSNRPKSTILSQAFP